MLMAMRLHLLVLAALYSSSVGQNNTNESQYDPNAQNTWVTEEDQQVAEWASQAVDTWCAGGFKGDRSDLAKAKGEAVDNIILTILEENLTDMNDPVKRQRVEELVKDYVNNDGILIILPIGLALVSVIIWLCCCCTACSPKCRAKCRACKPKERRAKRKMCIIIQAAIVVVFFLVLLVLALGIGSNHGRVVDGIDNMVCSASKLLNTTLGGEEGEGGFMGVMPLLEKFFWIEQQMKANSPLMNDVGAIIDSTADIEKSVVLVHAEIKLLGAMLEEYSNVYPAYGSNISLDHTCELCEKMGPILSSLGKDLGEGVGNALNKARSQVDTQLTYSKRKSLTDAVKKAADPLADAKKQMNDIMKSIVDPSVIKKDDVQLYQEQLLYPLVGLVLLALLLVCGGCCSTACCATSNWDGAEPSAVAPRCACCVWCFAFLYMFLVFLWVGVVNLVIMPSNMVCDVLTGLDGNLVQTIAEGRNENTTSDSFVIGKDLIDACWAGTAPSSNLLDIVFLTENNSKVYLRQKMVTESTQPIDDAFKKIIDTVASVNISLADNQAFVDLRNFIGSASASGLMIPSKRVMEGGGDWENDSTYGGLMLDTPVKLALATQTHCQNFTFEGNDIPGVQFFVDALKAIPGASPIGSPTQTCIQKVDCSNVVVSPDYKTACKSGNAFLDLKTKLMDGTAQFKCNLFKNKDGTVCDPNGMRQLTNGTWINDCLRVHEAGYAFTEQFERNCTLAEFDTYIKDFESRLQKSIKRLDDVTNSTLKIIVEDLRGLVDKYFVDTLHEIADGMTCGFMPQIKTEIVDGLCYQALAGFGSINNVNGVSAALIILLAIDMYVLFRVMIDNPTLAEKESDGGMRHQSE